MPKAKTYKNTRITRPPKREQSKKRRKEDGRPKGTLKKFQFEQTRLGFMIKHEAPVSFRIIMNLTPKAIFPEPSCEVIRIVCKASRDPSFGKAKFKRYLAEYASTGLYCKRGKKITPKRDTYYRAIRLKKMSLFIRRNKEKIRKMKAVTMKKALLSR